MPEDAQYFAASAMRHSADRLAPQGESARAELANGGWYYEEFWISFARGQLDVAAPDRGQFDPPGNVEAELEAVIARII